MVEALGDIAALLDRVDAVLPALDAARQATVGAGEQLGKQLEALEGRVAALTETARTKVVHYIVGRTEEAARRAQAVQSRAMADAAREVFRGEAERSLQRVAAALQRSSAHAFDAWQTWLTHAATAAIASAITWALMAWR